MKLPKFLATLKKPLAQSTVPELRQALSDADSELSAAEAAAAKAADEAVTGDYSAAEAAAQKAFGDIASARFRRDTLARRLQVAEQAEAGARRAADIAETETEAAQIVTAQGDLQTRLRAAAEELLSGYRAFISVEDAALALESRRSAHAEQCMSLDIPCTVPATAEFDVSALGRALEELGAPEVFVRRLDPEGHAHRSWVASQGRMMGVTQYARVEATLDYLHDQLKRLPHLEMSREDRETQTELFRDAIEQAERELASLAEFAPKPTKPVTQPPRHGNTVDGDVTPLDRRYPSYMPTVQVGDLRGGAPTLVMLREDYERAEAEAKRLREAAEAETHRATAEVFAEADAAEVERLRRAELVREGTLLAG